jgi:UDP-N-acetylmuramoyl-tripeptide--D-alanyl-D-alanine ligase
VSGWPEAFVRGALGLPAAPGAGYDRIWTDSRSVAPGDLFVALSGERFDAHDFLPQAAASGARAAVVRRGTPAVPGLPLLEVDDPLRAFGALARARRRQIAGPVVAVTGTNGKTSTKEMLAAVLRARYRVHATRANLNNLIGVPTTILEAPADADALVIEAGANLPGEIARYREIIEPDITVITNVGAGHLEGFGSLEGVLAEKLALASGVPLAVVGAEPPELGERAGRTAERTVVAGLEGGDRTPQSVTLDADGRATLRVDGHTIRLPLPGRHLAANAMLAWTVGRELGVDPAAAAAALGALTIPGGRSEVRRIGRLTVLDDCYNANPQSFRAAIATARAMRADRRLVFVAGTMREMGTHAERVHAEIAADLVALEPDLLAVVGDFVPALEPYASRLGERLLTAPDPPALGPALAARLRGDELIILKASRGVALERILPLLASPAGDSD